MSRWRAYRSEIEGYMVRWILQTPLGTVRVHKILTEDHQGAHHDHPWSFVSLVLWGWYVERCPSRVTWRRTRHGGRRSCTTRTREAGSIAVRRATDRHTIDAVSPGGVWTLVVTGPRVQPWGFYTPEGKVPWRDYLRRVGWTVDGDDHRRDR